MKTKITCTLLTVLLLGLSPARVNAGDEAWAALGGFVVGVITGAVIENSDDVDASVSVAVGDYPGHHDRYGYRDRHDRWDRYDRHGRCKDRCGPRGHWETTRVRVWVPGCWEILVNHCGDRVRVWRPGHHVWREERVWVAYAGHGRCG